MNNTSLLEQKNIILQILNSPYENWDFAITIEYMNIDTKYIENISIYKNKYSFDNDNSIILRQMNNHESFTLDLIGLYNKSVVNLSIDEIYAKWKCIKDFINSNSLDYLLQGCDGWAIEKIYRNEPYNYDSSGELYIWCKCE
jgi:hypothetical protein